MDGFRPPTDTGGLHTHGHATHTYAHTHRLLRINSLPPDTPNLQQADIWAQALAVSPASVCFFPDPHSARMRCVVVCEGRVFVVHQINR